MNLKEQTVIFIKSEAIQRQLIGEVVKRFEQLGLKMTACKMIAPTKEQMAAHYPDSDEWYQSNGQKTYDNLVARGIKPEMGPEDLAKRTRQRLIDYFVNRPLIAMVWEGPNAIKLGRKIAGATNPVEAEIGSIRGDYSCDSYEIADGLERSIETIIHASGSTEDAQHEIKIWFANDEILNYDLLLEKIIWEKDWGRIKKSKK